MRTLNILLDEKYEDATFHDSELLSITVDFARRIASCEFMRQCRATAPDQQFSLQRGTVEFSGLCSFWVEPTSFLEVSEKDSSLWISADGPLPDERLQINGILPDDLPGDAFVHYLYSNSTNSFIVVAAKTATFAWHENKAQIS